MAFARHDRVKQVFLAALEHRGEERAEFLRLECGSDHELRRDVDALLAAHRESTILVGGLRPPGSQTRNSVERFARLLDVIAFLFRTRTRRLLVVAVTIALVLATGYWTRKQARDMLIAQAGSGLHALLESNATWLIAASGQWQSAVNAVVELPSVKRDLNTLLATRDVDTWNRAVSQINPLLAGQHYHSYFIIGREGGLVATSAGLYKGNATPSGMATLGRMTHQGGTIEFPSPGSDYGEPSDQGDLWPRVVILSPIRNPDGRIDGAFVLVLPLEQTGERLRQGRPFETGETYLFREDGLLLSPSRFAKDLERWKLAGPAGRHPVGAIFLRDPGRSLYVSKGLQRDEDPSAWPLTEVVRVAVARRKASSAEQSGVILTPYRDYRGVRVIGAWRWIRELRVGLTAEVDEEEILSTLRFIDWPIGIFAVLLASAAAWTILSSFLLSRLRVQTLAGEALGQYTLIEKIGEGGVGEVFLAQHARLRRPAAVKLLRRDRLSPPFLRQFEREAQAASRLRHPNTVEIYDFGQTREGLPYFVMEYVAGLDLGQWVRRHGAMVPARALHIARQICAALEEAHQQNVIHRDIKPANIMLCELAGRHDFVKILDFGLAKDMTFSSDETSPWVRSGTPFYTAPERLRAKADIDQRCDIYSLGVLLYFLICGCTPYESETDWIDATLFDDPIPPSRRVDLPGSVERIILECMAREPDGRPASARNLLDRLCGIDDVPLWTPEDAQAAGANP